LTRNPDPPVNLFKQGTVNLAYRQSGNPARPAVLLLHGLAENAAFFWRPLIEALHNDFRFIAVDLPGHGHSDNPLSPLKYRSSYQAQLLVSLIDHLQLKQAMVLGHSLGGILAAHLAINHPSRVSRLILYDVPLPKGFFGNLLLMFDIPLKALLPVLFFAIPGSGFCLDRLLPKRWLTKRLLHNWKVPYDPARLSDEFLDYATDSRGVGLENQLRALLFFNNLETQLHRIQCPTLLIKGEDDILLSPRQAKRMIQLISDVQLEIIAEAGHLALFDQPGVFSSSAHDFMKRD
jgi:pimeloyl-ACP methyl ester carboxylesterase